MIIKFITFNYYIIKVLFLILIETSLIKKF